VEWEGPTGAAAVASTTKQDALDQVASYFPCYSPQTVYRLVRRTQVNVEMRRFTAAQLKKKA
jgi:hypothetical protein